MSLHNAQLDTRGLEEFARYKSLHTLCMYMWLSYSYWDQDIDGLANGYHKTLASHPLQEAFLPHGYPESVSDDYLAYQIWDTFQVCCN